MSRKNHQHIYAQRPAAPAPDPRNTGAGVTPGIDPEPVVNPESPNEWDMLPPEAETAKAGYHVTPAQRRLINVLAVLPSLDTVDEICHEAAVDPSSYYRWLHQPGYRILFTGLLVQNVLLDGVRHLNAIRALSESSPVHFKALHNLLFTERGIKGLVAWQKAIREATAFPPLVEDDQKNESGEISPTVTARQLRKTMPAPAPATAPPSTPVRAPAAPAPPTNVVVPIQHSQQLTGEN